MIRTSITVLSLLCILQFRSIESDIEVVEKIESSFFKETNSSNSINTSNSIKMYQAIEKYSEMYNVPKYIAYNVAYRETRYKGPFHWDYKHYQESFAGAIGPMQIMLATARSPIYSMGEEITREELMNNIDLNVKISMRILSSDFEKTGNWELTCGKYNTGKLIINDYARYCANNKDYKRKWIKY